MLKSLNFRSSAVVKVFRAPKFKKNGDPIPEGTIQLRPLNGVIPNKFTFSKDYFKDSVEVGHNYLVDITEREMNDDALDDYGRQFNWLIKYDVTPTSPMEAIELNKTLNEMYGNPAIYMCDDDPRALAEEYEPKQTENADEE